MAVKAKEKKEREKKVKSEFLHKQTVIQPIIDNDEDLALSRRLWTSFRKEVDSEESSESEKAKESSVEESDEEEGE